MKDTLWMYPNDENNIYVTRYYDNIDIQDIYNRTLNDWGTCSKLIEGLDSQSAVIILRDCKCCSRHQINKPQKFELWKKKFDDESEVSQDQEYKLQQCSCDCRHLIRWLCRGETVENLCSYCDE